MKGKKHSSVWEWGKGLRRDPSDDVHRFHGLIRTGFYRFGRFRKKTHNFVVVSTIVNTRDPDRISDARKGKWNYRNQSGNESQSRDME